MYYLFISAANLIIIELSNYIILYLNISPGHFQVWQEREKDCAFISYLFLLPEQLPTGYMPVVHWPTALL